MRYFGAGHLDKGTKGERRQRRLTALCLTAPILMGVRRYTRKTVRRYSRRSGSSLLAKATPCPEAGMICGAILHTLCSNGIMGPKTIRQPTCLQCGHKWYPRTPKKPAHCANCGTAPGAEGPGDPNQGQGFHHGDKITEPLAGVIFIDLPPLEKRLFYCLQIRKCPCS